MESAEGVATDCDPEKIEVMKACPNPYKVKQLQVCLGMMGYYRQFARDFANIAEPLTVLTSKRVP